MSKGFSLIELNLSDCNYLAACLCKFLVHENFCDRTLNFRNLLGYFFVSSASIYVILYNSLLLLYVVIAALHKVALIRLNLPNVVL